jgi:hypothetical protein
MKGYLAKILASPQAAAYSHFLTTSPALTGCAFRKKWT